MTWTVERVGFAPVKGTRHLAYPAITLGTGGPVGDRRFCLVDPGRGRALRTVQNPELVAVRADWTDPVLSCRFPDHTVISAPVALTDDQVSFDYWGRTATGQVVAGPWAGAFGRYLGADLLLVACPPGDVVFGEAVTVVTRTSIDNLAARLGTPIDPARWRATVVIDDSTDAARTPEPDWIGRSVQIGGATISITAPVARCAVIDICPETGSRDGALLKVLRRSAPRDELYGDPIFGVQATVARPGPVLVGDRAELLP
ncbi:MOSC domain-containing protein [Microlunatus soli]|uniref:MOSC domain-containing protein n=1 Tax=Microlunatus soli TaxID=630515 RepID=A0A1H1TAJ5_9ACTN|nr:MOSC N-terminal beta barrel domain-containing protein [Microlunatus soli]SDS57193.1 hypothetical protein SAMN04489812_2318 [Microlunatus soli]